MHRLDLSEVIDISENTTYSQAAGSLLGVVDNVSSAALDDGEFDEGDNILIDGVSYNIGQIQEPTNSGRSTLGDLQIRRVIGRQPPPTAEFCVARSERAMKLLRHVLS